MADLWRNFLNRYITSLSRHSCEDALIGSKCNLDPICTSKLVVTTICLLQVDEIREMIDTIADDVKKVKAKHGEILADPNTDDSMLLIQ